MNLIKKIYIIYITLFISIIFFIYYLFKINNIINLKLVDIYLENKPILIYSKILNIDLNSDLKKNDIINILSISKYNKKENVLNPGDFCLKKNNELIIFKRSFYFPNGYEKEILLKILFDDKDNILSIVDINNNILENINIEPKIIYILNSNNNKNKIFLPKNKFPNTLIKMLLEIEDKNFYNHKGINLSSIIRSIIKNFINMKIVEGGSTITQQLVKNLLLNNKKNFIRKINEIIISLVIEFKLSKNEILELYLNEINLGNFGNKIIKGFQLGSIYYFGKNVNELDLNEQAILIGLLKGTSLYNPLKNYNIVNKRKNIILKKIRSKDIINNKLFNNLISKKLILNINNNIFINNSSYINILIKEIRNIIFNGNLNNNIKIFSTLDLITQTNCNNIIKSSISKLKKNNNINDIETSMLIINRKNGNIKSSIGGFNNNMNNYNRIFINRQIGSLIKPFIYLFALSQPNKYNLGTILSDNKIIIKQSNNNWIPNNHDNKFRGKVKLIDSLVYSLNIPTINLGIEIGINNIINNLLKFGIYNNRKINNFPSFLLGSINLSLIEIAQMYQVISNYGNKINISSIEYILDYDNNIIYKNNYESKNIISSQSSYLVLYCMKKITEIGTAKILNKLFPNIIFLGKTGTTNNFRDNWFVGIDDKEICIIWVGKDNNLKLDLNGSNGALYIYKNYIEKSNPKSFNLEKPSDIHDLYIDKLGNIFCCNNYDYEKVPIWVNDYIKDKINCCNTNPISKFLNNFFDKKNKW